MRWKNVKFRGWRKLVLAILSIFILVSGAVALNVTITRTVSDVVFSFFEITSAATYAHTGGAPAAGSTYTEVGYGVGQPVDNFQVTNGSCLTHNVYLWVRDDWYLELNANITTGTAKACVYSSEVLPCVTCSQDGPGGE